MCKVLCLRYECGHMYEFCLSKCRGAFSGTSRRTGLPSKNCRLNPFLRRGLSSLCGACVQRDKLLECDEREELAEAEVRRFRDKLDDPKCDRRTIDEDHSRLKQAQESARRVRYDNYDIMDAAAREFPFRPKRVPTSPPPARRLRGSLLCLEIKPEDIGGDCNSVEQ
ncbi:hypothetical protein BAUCODRAFT_407116 [Baudoinia panamericana UAMH 10762]|uniref:Uncharacterized protein n=1 Tax=Baudoinia panamericana (strain UAMH 10762) TaxID=717646 RepID=M2N1U7_BAUPA|nr:uncharacterized protein BAUCODRAFT_407116 [Baudoinia panamericana UAMH 10762]EMC97898.1 hypothetical protein BAUCODRAFT_407116 [Baudoinia panamericana UAMH 10762]